MIFRYTPKNLLKWFLKRNCFWKKIIQISSMYTWDETSMI